MYFPVEKRKIRGKEQDHSGFRSSSPLKKVLFPKTFLTGQGCKLHFFFFFPRSQKIKDLYRSYFQRSLPCPQLHRFSVLCQGPFDSNFKILFSGCFTCVLHTAHTTSIYRHLVKRHVPVIKIGRDKLMRTVTSDI